MRLSLNRTYTAGKGMDSVNLPSFSILAQTLSPTSIESTAQFEPVHIAQLENKNNLYHIHTSILRSSCNYKFVTIFVMSNLLSHNALTTAQLANPLVEI